MLNDLSRVAANDDVVWNILRHHGAGSDDHIVPDAHTGVDDRLPADPHVMADGDGFAVFGAGDSRMRIQRVSG